MTKQAEGVHQEKDGGAPGADPCGDVKNAAGEAEPSAVERVPLWMAAVAYTQGEKWFIALMGCRAKNRFEAEGWLQQKCRDLGRKVEQITVSEEPMEYAEPQRSQAAQAASQVPGMPSHTLPVDGGG